MSQSQEQVSPELKAALSQILLDTSSITTEAQLSQLILQHQSSQLHLQYILTEIAQDINKFALIKHFIRSFPHKLPLFVLLPQLFTILQGYINQRNFNDTLSVFNEISTCFSEDNSTKKAQTAQHIDSALSFCLFNIRESEAIFQSIGSLCLVQLIASVPLDKALIRTVFKNVIDFVENSAFKAQGELLSLLDVLIERANCYFSPYATITLYKALDFLTDSNDLLRQRAVKVIFNLVYYCNADISDLKLQIIEFVDILANDPNEDVREISSSILEIINDPSKQFVDEKSNAMGSVNKESVLLNEAIASEENALIERDCNGEEAETEEVVVETKGMMMRSPLKQSNDEDSNTCIRENRSIKRTLLFNEVNSCDVELKSRDDYEGCITELLKQMKEMSDSQLHLLDTITSLRNSAQEQIATLTERISALESLISNSKPLPKPKVKAINKQLSSSNSSLQTALTQALSSSDKELIKAIDRISITDIPQLNQPLIEDCISRVTTILSKGSHIHSIISFLKNFLTGIQFKLKRTTISNLSNILSYINTNTVVDIPDQDTMDIALLQALLLKLQHS